MYDSHILPCILSGLWSNKILLNGQFPKACPPFANKKLQLLKKKKKLVHFLTK